MDVPWAQLPQRAPRKRARGAAPSAAAAAEPPLAAWPPSAAGASSSASLSRDGSGGGAAAPSDIPSDAAEALAGAAPLGPGGAEAAAAEQRRQRAQLAADLAAGEDVSGFNFEYRDHTADIQIHAWGDSLEEAFAGAALGERSRSRRRRRPPGPPALVPPFGLRGPAA